MDRKPFLPNNEKENKKILQDLQELFKHEHQLLPDVIDQILADCLWIINDQLYGTAGRNHLLRLVETKQNESIKKFANKIAGRRRNIERFRDNLDPSKPFDGPEIIIVGVSNSSEVERQKELLEKVFGGGRKTIKGEEVKIFVFKKKWMGPGGHFFAPMEMLAEAEIELSVHLKDKNSLFANRIPSISIFPQQGESSRSGILGASYSNTRANIPIGGSIKVGGSTIPLTLSLAVIAASGLCNQEGYVDVVWTSQIYLNSKEKLQVSLQNTSMSKFAKELSTNETSLVNAFTIKNFSMVGTDDHLNVCSFDSYGRRSNDEDLQLLIDRRIAWIGMMKRCFYDLGSHRFDYKFYREVCSHFYSYLRKLSEKGVDNNVDVMYFQQIAKFSNLINNNKNKNLNPPKDLQYWIDGEILKKMESELSIFNLSDNEKYCDLLRDFFFKNRQWMNQENSFYTVAAFESDSYWWTYRSPEEIFNEHMRMIGDIAQALIEISHNKMKKRDLALSDKIEAEDLRRMHGITHLISNSWIGDTYIEGSEISIDDVKDGINVGGVFISGSIIQDSIIQSGSIVIDSIIERHKGKVDFRNVCAENCYHLDKVCRAKYSILCNIIETKQDLNFIQKNGFDDETIMPGYVITDLFSQDILDPRFPQGQTRMIAKLTEKNLKMNKEINNNVYGYDEIDRINLDWKEIEKIRSKIEKELHKNPPNSKVISLDFDHDIYIPGIGMIHNNLEILPLKSYYVPGEGELVVGKDGITALAKNISGEFVFIARGSEAEMMLVSKLGFNPPRFPIYEIKLTPPIIGVLLDLDGTCVKSEPLWIGVLLTMTNEMRGFQGLKALSRFSDIDLPHVSGRTVPEHLKYCHDTYFNQGNMESNLNQARMIYDRITMSEQEIDQIVLDLKSKGNNPYIPADGLKELLIYLKKNGIKIALVTSGLHYKAYPEALSAFKQMNLEIYDYINVFITSGIKPGTAKIESTMGDAIAKPWPNIYLEAAIALGWNTNNSDHFLIVGDSASDVGSARTAGIPVIGVKGGNILKAGVSQLCIKIVDDLYQLNEFINKTNSEINYQPKYLQG